MFLTFDFPFANIMAQVGGYYTPAIAGFPFYSNGDPGEPDEPAEFAIHDFCVGGEDVLIELASMYIKRPKDMAIVNYLDFIEPMLLVYAGKAYYDSKIDC